MNLIDWRDGRPIYEQIVHRIKHLILSDVILPGEQLPSVRSLAMENATNPNTVQKAYSELEREGFIYTVRGRGVFVTDSTSLKEKKRAELKDEIKKLLNEASDVGISPRELCDEALKELENNRREQ